MLKNTNSTSLERFNKNKDKHVHQKCSENNMLKHYSCSEAYEQIIFQHFVYKDSIKKEIENI